MVKKENILIEKYLKQHSLVESNILSFNDFVNNRMQDIVNDINRSLNQEEVQVKIGKVKIGRPNIIHAD